MHSSAKAAYYSLKTYHIKPSALAEDISPSKAGSTMHFNRSSRQWIGPLPTISFWERVLPLLFLIFSVLALQPHATAQQEPQFTKYMFNTLSINPGYAGSKGYMSIVALHRDQWLGWGNATSPNSDGRPRTQTFSIHSTINRSVGLGLNLTNDQIGSHRSTLANISYAYRIAFGKGTLSLGLQAGAMNWKANWDDLAFKDARELDNAFNNGNPSEILPDFGAGIYFFTDYFYAGASLPHLAQFNLREVTEFERETIRKWAKNYRHFYFTAGGAMPLNGNNLVFRPSLLVKTVGFFPEFFKSGSLVREIGSPTVFDVDASFLIHEKIWAGLAFRSAFAAFFSPDNKTSSFESADIWAALLLENGMRIGFAYDYPLNEIANYSSGSMEIMIGFDFYKKLEKINSPRYF